METSGSSARHVRPSTVAEASKAVRRGGVANAGALPTLMVLELVAVSHRHLEEMLKELNALIASEKDPARKESMAKVRDHVLKERANFRLLARHVNAPTPKLGRPATPKIVLDAPEDDDDASDDGAHTTMKKQFQSLPAKLAEKFVKELPGWCIHVERPEIFHLAHCRYDAIDREFFCDVAVSLLQRPDIPERVFVNILFVDPSTNNDNDNENKNKNNQRFVFPLIDIMDTLVPLLKSAEQKWIQQTRRRLAQAATTTSATTTTSAPPTHDDVRVKAELEDESSLGDDSTPIPISPPPNFDDASYPANGDPEQHSPTRSRPASYGTLNTSAIVEGKRRRKSRLSRDIILEAMDEDDVTGYGRTEEGDDATKAKFEKAARERAKDADFRDKSKKKETPYAELRDDDVLGKCCHCFEYLRYDQALTHMAEKHPEDIIRRLHCPICNKVSRSITLEQHLRKSHSEASDRTRFALFCPTCPRSFLRQEYLDEHVIEKHEPEKKNALCIECGLKFASERLLLRHQTKQHSPELKQHSPETTGEQNGRDDDDDDDDDEPEVTAPSKKYAKKELICHLCGKEYEKPDELDAHLVVVHAAKEPAFDCPACPKKFASRNRLVEHLKTHTNQMRFECPTCKKRFKTRHNLHQHQNTHGPPKHECEHCGRKFSFRTCWLNHLKAVHKDLHSPEDFRDEPMEEMGGNVTL